RIVLPVASLPHTGHFLLCASTSFGSLAFASAAAQLAVTSALQSLQHRRIVRPATLIVSFESSFFSSEMGQLAFFNATALSAGYAFAARPFESVFAFARHLPQQK